MALQLVDHPREQLPSRRTGETLQCIDTEPDQALTRVVVAFPRPLEKLQEGGDVFVRIVIRGWVEVRVKCSAAQATPVEPE